jgi:endonuclease/exonuclease/phosphatase family metal-dependent hydrolase
MEGVCKHCLQARDKKIKSIDQNFLWTVNNYEGVPIHTIKVYIPPGDHEKAKKIIRLIRWVISEKTLIRDPEAKILLMGDFNLIGIHKLDFLKNLGLAQIIPA